MSQSDASRAQPSPTPWTPQTGLHERKTVRVAIQGEPGSNSHLAVQALLGAQTLVPCALSADVFACLSANTADAAVLPIENSLHGAVADHYDLLLEHNVTILAESALRIRHALIAATGTRLADLRTILSHPVALNQCRRFFSKHPHLQAMPFYDTAGAVKHVVSTGDRTLGAIAAPAAAQVYGGNLLQHDLEDDPLNFTRFFLLAPASQADRLRTLTRPAGEVADKMSFAFAIPHRPGSLVHLLQGLAHLGADLTRIESRPVPGKPWEYIFFVDLRLPTPSAGPRIADLLQSQCTMFRLLGQFGTHESTDATISDRDSAGTRR